MTASRVACATFRILSSILSHSLLSPACRRPPPTRLLTQTGPVSNRTPSGGVQIPPSPSLHSHPSKSLRRVAMRRALTCSQRSCGGSLRASKGSSGGRGGWGSGAQPLAPPAPCLSHARLAGHGSMGASQRPLYAWRPGTGEPQSPSLLCPLSCPCWPWEHGSLPKAPVCLATKDRGGASSRAGPMRAWECGSRPAPPEGLGRNDMSALRLPKGRGWG